LDGGGEGGVHGVAVEIVPHHEKATGFQVVTVVPMRYGLSILLMVLYL
jgi:hypothetical protein